MCSRSFLYTYTHIRTSSDNTRTFTECTSRKMARSETYIRILLTFILQHVLYQKATGTGTSPHSKQHIIQQAERGQRKRQNGAQQCGRSHKREKCSLQLLIYEKRKCPYYVFIIFGLVFQDIVLNMIKGVQWGHNIYFTC